MDSNNRLLLWQKLRALWDAKQTTAAELLPMLQHYIALTEASEGSKARPLIAPLRWLGLLYHQLKNYEQEREALVRCHSLMERYLGNDHHQSVECLVALLGVEGPKKDSEVRQRIALHYLAKRRHAIDAMDERLLSAFVFALYEPLAGNCSRNRTAFTLLHRRVLLMMKNGVTPEVAKKMQVELCWWLAREVGREIQMVPILRLLKNVLTNEPVLNEYDQELLSRLQDYIAEATNGLSSEQLQKIRPALQLVSIQ
jgi:hypothetical protein